MLRTEVADGVATITIDCPERLNALNFELFARLREAVETLSHDPDTRALVITGAGRAFSSGADLRDLDAVTADLPQRVADTMTGSANPLCEALLAAPVPVVAAVNGPCAGGAVGLALLADVTIAARSAYFLIPQVSALSLVPDVGATWVLAKHVGRARALSMSLLGERIAAEQARDWGMIWRCVDDEALVDSARETALRLGAAPEAVVATRGLIDTSYGAAVSDQLADETRHQYRMFHNPAVTAAIERFTAARPLRLPVSRAAGGKSG